MALAVGSSTVPETGYQCCADTNHTNYRRWTRGNDGGFGTIIWISAR